MNEENKQVDFRCSQDQLWNILNTALLEGMILQIKNPNASFKHREEVLNNLITEASKLNLNL